MAAFGHIVQPQAVPIIRRGQGFVPIGAVPLKRGVPNVYQQGPVSVKNIQFRIFKFPGPVNNEQVIVVVTVRGKEFRAYQMQVFQSG